MKLLRSWLEEFVDLAHRSDEEIAADLESLGHEVESITPVPLENVVVGEITEITKHPDADRLSVAQVDIGDKSIQLIFGQYFPVKVGDRLPVAVAPCTLPTGMVIEARKIRGVDSGGMLAADGELGRKFTEEGILRFDKQAQPGTLVADLVGWQETVFELSLTPNRGDVFSLLGVARELAAKWETELIANAVTPKIDPDKADIAVTIADPGLCPRYSARLIENIHITHAPTVIAGRLGFIEHGQYNSVVDITNYVMEEFGVPLHAFDADKLSLPLEIRRAKTGETLELLNKQTVSLDDSMLVISDKTGPVALAGIIGGLATAVTDQTTRVLLEAAYFTPANIRRTRTKLRLLSDSAYRFERGTDPAALERASNRAAVLIAEGSQARVGKLQLVGGVPQVQTIPFDPKQLNSYLGTNLDNETIFSILKRLGLLINEQSVTVPSWRHDMHIWQDLAEEVARLVGYDQLPHAALAAWQMPSTPDDDRYLALESLKDQLAREGWTEHQGSSFLSVKEVELLGLAANQAIKLANPVSEEAAYLRTTLLVSLLKVMAKNPIFPHLKVFEMGTVWMKESSKTADEQTTVALIWAGTKPETLPFSKEPLGQPVNQQLLDTFKIRRPVMFAQVLAAVFLEHLARESAPMMRPLVRPTYRTPSRYQPAMRDIAILVDDSVAPDQIIQALVGLEYLTDIELFDRFIGGTLPAGKQSLAFHLLFEHPDRTLTSEEIDTCITEVTHRLKKHFQAEIR